MKFIILACAALLMATPVAADWQETTWTMSRAEVIRVTGAQGVQGTPGQRVSDSDLGAEGQYEALGFNFKSQFFFDRTDRLRVVKLVLDDVSRCADLRTAVQGIYATPVSSDRLSTLWLDGAQNNQVRYTGPIGTISPDCFLVYTPIVASGSSGL